jgi:hypothetical protein
MVPIVSGSAYFLVKGAGPGNPANGYLRTVALAAVAVPAPAPGRLARK